MLEAIESKSEMAEAQREFEEAFKPFVEESYSVEIGYQSGSAHRKVICMPKLNLWAHFGFPPSDKGPPSRYWNVFGLGWPSGMVSIVCEINPPIEASRHPPAGVYARDESDRLVVIHRGKFNVTGGMKVSYVKRHVRAERVSFLDRGKAIEGILVAKTPSREFGSDVRDFVMEVHRV